MNSHVSIVHLPLQPTDRSNLWRVTLWRLVAVIMFLLLVAFTLTGIQHTPRYYFHGTSVATIRKYIRPPLPECQSSSDNLYPGNWRYINGQFKWLPSECTLKESFDLTSTDLYFIGNSHIRNLFRCTADLTSDGMSYSNSSECHDIREFANNHCLSCLNMSPIHGQDYTFYNREFRVSMHFYWTVFWAVSRESRTKCLGSSGRYAQNATDRYCLISRHDPASVAYANGHVGVDLIHNELALEFSQSDGRRRAVILNFSSRLNDLWAARQFIQHLTSQALIPIESCILVVDVSAAAESTDAIELFRGAGIHVLDMRPIYNAYPFDSPLNVSQDDIPLAFKNHLHGPFQRLLVTAIISIIKSIPTNLC